MGRFCNMKRPRNSADDAKVAQCLNLKGFSNDAFRKILGRLGESQPSKNKVQVLQQEHFSQVKEVLKLPCLDGTEMNWEVANPSTLVSHSARHSKEMERAFAQALQWHPCSVEKPWRLAVTFDEFTPGNMLRPNNPRKTMVANFSFLELDAFGDNTWWTMAVARTSTINNIDGGLVANASRFVAIVAWTTERHASRRHSYDGRWAAQDNLREAGFVAQ